MRGRRTLLQSLIARGALVPTDPPVPVDAVVAGPDGGWRQVAEPELPGHLPDLRPGGLAVLLPTYVGRCTLAEQRECVAHLVERLAEVNAADPDLPLSLWIGMQWAAGERVESVHRLGELGRLATRPWLTCIGLSLPAPGKLRTTNAAIRLAAPLRPVGWLWVDDDVFLEPACLRRLVGRFLDRGVRGAVGAAKVAQAKAYLTSKAMRRLGQLTAPYRTYPHACCMVVAASVVVGGVPNWLGSDDGYVLFELLDPARADPWQDLEILPSARCRYFLGSAASETFRRLHRALYVHLLFVASYPWPVGRAYLTQTLFYGLWPLAPWDRRHPVGPAAARWLVKAIHFSWFSGVAASLVVRGLVHRPRRPPAIAPYAEHWSALHAVQKGEPCANAQPVPRLRR